MSRLTIQQITNPEYANLGVWVVNKSRGDIRGPIMMTCPAEHGGGVETLILPDTFLPINLLEMVPHSQLIKSSDFRKAVTRGLVGLIDSAESEELLSQPGAAEELERLRKESDRVAAVLAQSAGQSAEATQVLGMNKDDESGPTFNKKVVNYLARVGDSGEVATINSLRAIAEDLTIEDLQHISSYAKERDFKKLRTFARNRLADRV